MKTKKRVLFSVLMPNEGFIDVEAVDNAEAERLVIELLGHNYRDLKIVDISDLETSPIVSTSTETPGRILN